MFVYNNVFMYLLKAKFHYAIWFEAGSKLVADMSATSFEPDSVWNLAFSVFMLPTGVINPW